MLYNLPGTWLIGKGNFASEFLHGELRNAVNGVLLVLLVMASVIAVDCKTLSVGVVYSGDCRTDISSLVRNTVDAVNQDYPSSVNLDYRLVEVCDRNMMHLADALNETYNLPTANSAVIVKPYSTLCHIPSLYAVESTKLTVLTNCLNLSPPISSAFSNSSLPSVVYLEPSVESVAKALDSLLKFYQWQDLDFVVSQEFSWLLFSQSVSVKMSSFGYRVNHLLTIPPGANLNDLSKPLRVVNTGKVIILFMDVQDVAQTLIAWHNESKTTTSRVLLAVAPSAYSVPSWLQTLGSLSRIYLEGFLLLTPQYSDPVFNRTFNFTHTSGRSKRDVQYPINGVNVGIDVSLYDAFTFLLETANRSVDNGQSIDNTMHLFPNVVNTSVTSPFTNVIFDANGNVLMDYLLLAYTASSGSIHAVVSLTLTNSHDLVISVIQDVQWTDGIPPPDMCFFQERSCRVPQTESKAELILYILLGLVGVACAGLVVAYLVRRYLIRKEMEKGPNKLLLTSTDIVFVHRKNMNRSSKTLAKSTMFEKPDILKASEPSYSMTSLNDYVDFSDTARYNGDLVHVKEIQVKGFEMKGKLMSYLRMLRELRHENLNTFMGFLNESTRPGVITEFCNRGSLEGIPMLALESSPYFCAVDRGQWREARTTTLAEIDRLCEVIDVIQNEDIKLDWDFKLSLLTDLVRGLRYIHGSHLKHHGFLKSRNCVIDSRWVLKITDYGMQGILSTCKLTRDLEASDLLWTAPDLMRDPVALQKGNDKGDVFSLAIIMQEIILRTRPYSTTGLTPEEIIKKVRKPPPLIRPSVSQQAAPPQYIQLMKQCWAEMPDMRPDVEHIYQQFKLFNHGKKMNIVDTMFKMLEKYSSDLEEIVHNRTTQLEEEKKKTDQLLFRMLPAAVAQSLKIGRRVEAETFAEVTIYFSDIVGFTTISAMSTPLQVVDLLNDLYTMFDATIDMYDVYKVETIGDAYMVVSGLPTRNGNRHAGEVSTMALDLLSQCGTFVIRHMQEVPLRLRIGLHSGPCVAGVVGLTMPRYCLFGDTVNTASRMESTGGAFRVHLSQTTKEKLDELKGYKTVYRGEVELKGKGIHKTYWLTGKEGFDKPMPEPPDIGEDNHGLGSVLPESKEEPAPSKSKSKTNLADLVGALNTLRKAALGKSKNSKQDSGSGNKNTSSANSEQSTSGSSRHSTEGQVSLTPITLEERDTPPPPPVELSPLSES